MKFLLMMHAPRGTGDWGVADWTPERLQAHIDFMMKLNKELVAEGVLVAAEGLATPGEARIVRAGRDGAPMNIPIEIRQVMRGPGDEGCAQG